MQTRVLATVAGGLLGIVLTPTLNGAIGIPAALAYPALGLAGAALGCAVSLFFDVFTSTPAS